MEALSLTGFKTRSIISLITVLTVLLLSFAIQQRLIEQQKHNLVQAAIANELSERSKSLTMTLQGLLSAEPGRHRVNLKRYAVEHLSRISESLNYFQSTPLAEPIDNVLNSESETVKQLQLLINTTRTVLKDEEPEQIPDFNSASIRNMSNNLRQVADTLRETQRQHQEFQITALQQLLILSLTIISVSILFVVVPVLRRVKNDRAAIERQRTQIARIRHTFDTFTDHSQNAIINYVKSSGKINFVNNSCVEMLQYQSKNQLLGESIDAVYMVHTDETHPAMSARLIAIDGSEIPVVFDRFSSHRIEDGAELVWLNLTDLRPIIEVEQRSQNAQKMESMGTLASGIAHDFNNILAIIRGSSELLKMSVDLSNNAQKCVTHIIEAGERGASMVRQILQFSRADTEYLKVIDIVENIEQTLELLTPGLKKKSEVVFQCEAEGNILADESSISQILINLVKNASQAGATKVELTLKKENQEFVLTVLDDGSGIPQEAQDKLFEPFFSTKKKTEGTGLGLSVVHGIVQKIKGTISVDSTEGEGTRFTIRLPVTQLQVEEVVTAKPSSPMVSNQRILLVEDEDNLRNIYSTYLTMKGFSVTEAANGQEALAIFQQAKDEYDVLVTDHNMPGLLGTEVILAIRHLTKKPLLTIMVTGDIEDSARELKNQGLIDDILTKPIALSNLDGAIEQSE
ncbi:hypothetical protein MACH26_07520 [Planctobacterium marinum]|uniref:histidine kinase n=2 Tax=Planctobacterium marinum TaxID=1631968 RepID=A0AA48HIC8_9ALTE|nr:hypothetical protein MACH26_07520 [Planctobacterium marinum]